MGPHWGRCAHYLCALALSLAWPAASAKEVFEPGIKVLYKDGGGRVWCVTVVSLDVWVDGEHWAWFTVNDDPRRVGHAPVVELGSRCHPRSTGSNGVPSRHGGVG